MLPFRHVGLGTCLVLCEFQHCSLLIQVPAPHQIEGTRCPHYTKMSFLRTPSYQDVGLSIMWCMNSMEMTHPRVSVPRQFWDQGARGR